MPYPVSNPVDTPIRGEKQQRELRDLSVDAMGDEMRNRATKHVVGAIKELASRRLPTHKVTPLLKSSVRIPGLDAIYEAALGVKAFTDRRKPGGFKEQADEGDVIRKGSAPYQALKIAISPAEYTSRVGASMEREDRKIFEDYNAGAQRIMDEIDRREGRGVYARNRDFKSELARTNDEIRRSPLLTRYRETAPPREDYTGGVQRVFPTKHPMKGNSNVVMAGVNIDGMERVIPTMVDGKQLSVKEAVAIARRKGLDKYPAFKTVEEANAFAEKNHGNINEDGTLRKPKPVFPKSIREIRRTPLLKR